MQIEDRTNGKSLESKDRTDSCLVNKIMWKVSVSLKTMIVSLRLRSIANSNAKIFIIRMKIKIVSFLKDRKLDLRTIAIMIVHIFWKGLKFELVKSYRLLPYFSWPHIPKSDPANTLRIMLVADPQLPGYWNQPSSIFGSISRHDSDSYLARTYSQDRGPTDRKHDQPV